MVKTLYHDERRGFANEQKLKKSWQSSTVWFFQNSILK